MDVHDAGLPRLLDSLLIFLSFCILNCFLLHLRLFCSIKMGKYSPWLLAHWDRSIYATKGRFSTGAAHELLARFELIVRVIYLRILFRSFLLWDVHKSEISSFLYCRIIRNIHRALCFSINERTRSISWRLLIELDGCLFLCLRVDGRFFVDVFETSVMSFREVWWPIGL